MDSQRVKYPRTFHMSSSPGATADDKKLSKAALADCFAGKMVVLTEKMDGENTTIYPDGYSHARSLESAHHPSRSHLKELASLLAADLPKDLRVCGENLYAEHSIRYEDLSSFFQVFSMWREDECLSWLETMEWCALLNLETVPVIDCFPWVSEEDAIARWKKYTEALNRESEGFTVRLLEGFTKDEFSFSLVKYVRPGHVQTEDHWSHQAVVPNKLA